MKEELKVADLKCLDHQSRTRCMRPRRQTRGQYNPPQMHRRSMHSHHCTLLIMRTLKPPRYIRYITQASCRGCSADGGALHQEEGTPKTLGSSVAHSLGISNNQISLVIAIYAETVQYAPMRSVLVSVMWCLLVSQPAVEQINENDSEREGT